MSPTKAPGVDGLTAQILRKAWPVLGQDITRLCGRCITEATFPESWKEAKLMVIPKPGKDYLASPKSFRPISLLPVLGKALETLIIQDLVEKTDLDAFRLQHGFVSGRSTITAISELYEWTNANRCRHVWGAFLDIIGSSLRTLKIVQSYLQERTVKLNLELI